MKRYWLGAHCELDFRPGSSWRPELAAEVPATCTIELEPQGEATKLAITHTIAREKSKLIEAVSDGWPKILSNLKSLIETGEIVLPRT